jgi:hypothetical protein
MPVAPDATLADVRLTHPKTYFPPLIKLLEACALKHGSAYVRIGVTGDGSAPYYQITIDEQATNVIGAIDYGHAFTSNSSGLRWSTKTMGFLDVVRVAASFLNGES